MYSTISNAIIFSNFEIKFLELSYISIFVLEWKNINSSFLEYEIWGHSVFGWVVEWKFEYNLISELFEML